MYNTLVYDYQIVIFRVISLIVTFPQHFVLFFKLRTPFFCKSKVCFDSLQFPKKKFGFCSHCICNLQMVQRNCFIYSKGWKNKTEDILFKSIQNKETTPTNMDQTNCWKSLPNDSMPIYLVRQRIMNVYEENRWTFDYHELRVANSWFFLTIFFSY